MAEKKSPRVPKVLLKENTTELTKEEEIQILNKLGSIDTYFKQYFNYDLPQMVSNIKNDFAIELNTSFAHIREELERTKTEIDSLTVKSIKQRKVIEEQKLSIDTMNSMLNATLKELIKSGSPIPKALNIPLIQLIELKLRMGLELNSDETSHLLETKFSKDGNN